MIVNVHERRFPVPVCRVRAMLETLAGPADQIWHSDLVPPMVLDDGLAVGSRGGHGPIRYEVVEHVPGRLLRFRFMPGVGLEGTHTFEVLADRSADGSWSTTLRHTVSARAVGKGRVLWPLVIRPIHDAAAEDMLDHVERSLTGSASPRRTVPRWLNILARRGSRRTVHAISLAPGPLLAGALDRVDASDCWATRLRPGDSRDPIEWVTRFARPDPVVSCLLRIRDHLVRPLRLRTMPRRPGTTGFPLLAASPTEALVGLDDRHLSFRVGIRVVDGAVHVATTVQLHNSLGRLYWALVRHVHPFVVRRMIATAA